MLKPEDFFDLDETEHRVIFENVDYVWQALAAIPTYLQFRLKPKILGRLVGRPFISDSVFIGKGTIVEHGAMIKGPAWIGEDCEIRNGCYIRENVILGNGVVAGNSCEFKNCLLFNEAQVPHYNYVGDSILGHRAHLGAGVICSNVKLDRTSVVISAGEKTWDTGLKKFGAIVGDRAEVGCATVLSPGSLIGPGAILYPGSQWRGILPARHIAKVRQSFSIVERHKES